MFNRTLVSSVLFILLFVGAGFPATASPVAQPDSLPVAENNIKHRFRFEWAHLSRELLPYGQLAPLPEMPANELRDTYVSRYLSRYGDFLALMTRRSTGFFPIIDTIFRQYGIPAQLKYLAVVESELNTRALSRVGARGTWQLMPETARHLKLVVTDEYDERIHLSKSTRAAARYLRDLNKIFDDWLLVIAAYNSGPGPVLKAIKRSGSRNFWKLQAYLPAETRGHVKRFIAIHYYFEGRGSLITLTKQERQKYEAAVNAWMAEDNLLLSAKSTKGSTDDSSEDERSDSNFTETKDISREQEQKRIHNEHS